MGGAMAANILKAHGSAIVYDVRANLCVCVCARARAASLGAREATPMAHLWLDRDIHLDHCRALAPDCAPLVPPLEARSPRASICCLQVYVCGHARVSDTPRLERRPDR